MNLSSPTPDPRRKNTPAHSETANSETAAKESLSLANYTLPRVPEEISHDTKKVSEIVVRASTPNSPERSFVKSLSWRVLATLDTIGLSWLQTGSAHTGLKIGVTELCTKIGLFWLHDQAWERFGPKNNAHISLIKAVTWRVTGSLDTMFIAWWMTGSLQTGGKIALAEVITKTALFYVHERMWERIANRTRKKVE